MVFDSTAAAKPWTTCYPPVPNDFVWEDFTAFIPLIAIVVGISLVFTIIFGRKRSILDKVILFYFAISTIIHFGLERYYAEHNPEILNPKNNHMAARIWRHYGVSDTRWHGQQNGVDPAVYGCMYGLEWLAAYLCGPTVVLATIFYIIKSPWRWPMQCVTVTAQAYGLFITWLPAYWERLRSVPVKDPVLFYGYFYAWQMPWAILPVIAVLQAGYEISKIFKKAQQYDANQAAKAKNK